MYLVSLVDHSPVENDSDTSPRNQSQKKVQLLKPTEVLGCVLRHLFTNRPLEGLCICSIVCSPVRYFPKEIKTKTAHLCSIICLRQTLARNLFFTC